MSQYGKYGMPPNPKKKGHGAKGYWIVGEGYYEQDGGTDPKPEPGDGNMPDIEDPSSQMKFCRIFPDLEKFQPTREQLEPLGVAMADVSELPNPTDPPPDSTIPAGFTYFGQFVDHDISRGHISGIEVDDRDAGLFRAGTRGCRIAGQGIGCHQADHLDVQTKTPAEPGHQIGIPAVITLAAPDGNLMGLGICVDQHVERRAAGTLHQLKAGHRHTLARKRVSLLARGSIV